MHESKSKTLGIGAERVKSSEDGKRIRPLQHFEHAVLLSVSSLGANAFPAEIARRLSKALDRHVSLAQVFISLERMEDRGLVSSQESQPEQVRGGRRRRIFRLEASGVHSLSQTAVTLNRMSSQHDRWMEATNGETKVPSPT